MSGEFILNDDPERGIKTVGWFEDDGRMTVQVRQYVPDSFFKQVKMMRERAENRKMGTQSHWRQLPVLPHALADQLFRDGNGQMLPLNDPQRDKIWKRIQNDIDYRNLRVSEGSV